MAAGASERNFRWQVLCGPIVLLCLGAGLAGLRFHGGGEFLSSRRLQISEALLNCHSAPDLRVKEVLHNNLGLQGPDKGEEGIVYSMLDHNTGATYELVVNALNDDFRPYAPQDQGIYEKMQSVNVHPGSLLRARFTFRRPETHEVVAFPKVYVTFFDLDMESPGKGVERIEVPGGYSKYQLRRDSKIQATERGSSVIFQATDIGTGGDNPKDLLHMNKDELQKMVSIEYEKTQSFDVVMAVSEGSWPRFFFFEVRAALACDSAVQGSDDMQDIVSVEASTTPSWWAKAANTPWSEEDREEDLKAVTAVLHHTATRSQSKRAAAAIKEHALGAASLDDAAASSEDGGLSEQDAQALQSVLNQTHLQQSAVVPAAAQAWPVQQPTVAPAAQAVPNYVFKPASALPDWHDDAEELVITTTSYLSLVGWVPPTRPPGAIEPPLPGVGPTEDPIMANSSQAIKLTFVQQMLMIFVFGGLASFLLLTFMLRPGRWRPQDQARDGGNWNEEERPILRKDADTPGSTRSVLSSQSSRAVAGDIAKLRVVFETSSGQSQEAIFFSAPLGLKFASKKLPLQVSSVLGDSYAQAQGVEKGWVLTKFGVDDGQLQDVPKSGSYDVAMAQFNDLIRQLPKNSSSLSFCSETLCGCCAAVVVTLVMSVVIMLLVSAALGAQGKAVTFW
eukprot:TRINITY_DN56665_c0_g1_i1.p1 TRINITY_DN56665_c0_g1~~TRINITY_DN56665_c0_g1_i1.p1  ORF type:complete len:684 (+),score=158.24 TRINITY_DN56665_c0_g1_i1:30-2054(+)